MNRLDWKRDELTAQAAKDFPLPIKSGVPAQQYQGCGFNSDSWDKRVVQPSSWPPGFIKCSPKEIIRQFEKQRYTQALAMVACWGNMFRHPESVWGDRPLPHIENALHSCAGSLQSTRTIEDSWRILTGANGLRWSSVLTSKTLHFLCRSLGFEQNPPVAIDGKIIRERVWPIFRNAMPLAKRPSDWEGNSFEAYCRYMTAIAAWAEKRDWSTSEMEATVFAEYQ